MNKLPLFILSFVMLIAACGNSPERSTVPQANANRASSQPSRQSETPPSTEVKESNSNCDPNYSGCVPIASDVDCAGGGGNGPAYVRGPIRVIGTDIYGLDRDGDGIACEK